MHLLLLLALEFLVQYAGYLKSQEAQTKLCTRTLTKNVVSELWELQAHRPELVLGFGTQSVTASSPKIGDRGTDGGIVLLGVSVDVSGVCDLALCGGIDAVNLGGCERLESWEVERLAESVDSSMLQELVTCLIDFRRGWVSLEVARASNLAREVVASV